MKIGRTAFTKAVSIVFLLLYITFAACGCGGDGANKSDSQDQNGGGPGGGTVPPKDNSNELLTSVANLVTGSLAGAKKDLRRFERLSDILTLMNISALPDLPHFNCGIAENDPNNDMVTYIFNGNPYCDELTGAVEINYLRLATGSIDSFDITYDDLGNDVYSIHGMTSTEVVVDGNSFVFNHAFQEFTFFNKPYNGSTTFTYDDTAGTIVAVAMREETLYLDDGTEVNVEYSVSSINPIVGMTGEIAIFTNDEEYSGEFHDILVDVDCGLPTSGTLCLNGINLDYSHTSCDDPVVSVIVGGFTFELSLEEALNRYLMSNGAAVCLR